MYSALAGDGKDEEWMWSVGWRVWRSVGLVTTFLRVSHILNWGLWRQHRNQTNVCSEYALDAVIPLTFCVQINTFLSPSRSMIPAQCAEKALTVSTIASRRHQNPQKPAPSGRSNRRGRRSEKRAKQLYLLYCFQETCFSPQSFPHSTDCF